VPVAGVARNPLGETPHRFRRERPVVVTRNGQTPGTMTCDVNDRVDGRGTIRRVFRQAVNVILPADPISWSYNNGQGHVTRALRYKAASTYVGAGSRTQYARPRPIRPATHRMLPITRSAGNKRNLPAVRNRMASFGRRVPSINKPLRPRS
jgi:hypothetical protein